MVNIYTTDVQNIIQAALYFHYLWVLPVEILIALYMLYSSVCSHSVIMDSCQKTTSCINDVNIQKRGDTGIDSQT